MSAQSFEVSINTYTTAMSGMSKISKIQTDALTQIARCEVSSSGSLAMKQIAEAALVECHKIAAKTEEQIKQN